MSLRVQGREDQDRDLLEAMEASIRQLADDASAKDKIRELSPVEEENVCPIALESFRKLAEQGELVTTKCGHKFSQVEVVKWLSEHERCPHPGCAEKALVNDLAPVRIAQKVVNVANTLSSSSSSPASVSEVGHQTSFEEFARVAPVELHKLIAESILAKDPRDGGSVDELISYIRTLPVVDQPKVWVDVLSSHNGILVTQLMARYSNDIEQVPDDVKANFAHPLVQRAVKDVCISVRSGLTAQNIDNFTKRFTQIEGFDVSGRGAGLNDDGVCAIARNLPHVKGLTFTDSEGIGAGDINALLSLNEIEYITICGCYGIGRDAVRRLVAKFGSEKILLQGESFF